MPNKHQSKIREAFVIIGGINLVEPVLDNLGRIGVKKMMDADQGETYPFFSLHGVINLENPYPQTFLFTVMLTNKLPAAGL